MHFWLAFALASLLAPTAPTPSSVVPAADRPPFERIDVACQGCGCRGGPGWRIHRTGQCAGKKNLA
jgi:hypothetical protein